MGKAFGFRVLGKTQLTARRTTKFMDSMRRPDGASRENAVQSPTGQSIKIYINRDRNPKQVKEDILWRRLQRVVAKHLTAKGNSTIPCYKKRDKTLHISWQPAIRL